MILLGLTGAIGHGKTSLAEALDAYEPSVKHFESSSLIMEFANAWKQAVGTAPAPSDLAQINQAIGKLPAIIRKMFGLSVDTNKLQIEADQLSSSNVQVSKLLDYLNSVQQKPSLWSQPIERDNKEASRSLLQWLGGYLSAKVDPGIWYNQLVKLAEQAAKTGAKLCTISGLRYQSDAQIVRQAGGVVVQILRPDVPEPDMTDPTERSRHQIVADVVVVNNGSLEQLHGCAEQLYQDLQNQRVKGRYSAN